jgi:hypothetical protein
MEREQRVVQEFQKRVLNVACQTTWIMRHNPHHANDDPEVVRRMIRENPWGILVSRNRDELVASHYPILLDEKLMVLRSSLTWVGLTRCFMDSANGRFC